MNKPEYYSFHLKIQILYRVFGSRLEPFLEAQPLNTWHCLSNRPPDCLFVLPVSYIKMIFHAPLYNLMSYWLNHIGLCVGPL